MKSEINEAAEKAQAILKRIHDEADNFKSAFFQFQGVLEYYHENAKSTAERSMLASLMLRHRELEEKARIPLVTGETEDGQS